VKKYFVSDEKKNVFGLFEIVTFLKNIDIVKVERLQKKNITTIFDCFQKLLNNAMIPKTNLLKIVICKYNI